MTSFEIAVLWHNGKAVLLDTDRKISFGPIFSSYTEAEGFIAYITQRFPLINVSSINTQRLCIYYKEFLDAQVSSINS